MRSEVEVKAKVKDFDTIIAKLKELDCVLSEPITQDDYVYNQKGKDLKNYVHDTPVLRIRVQEDRTIFTLKKNRSNELDCIEKEIDIIDKDTLAEMIELLGYEKTVEIHKKRRKGKYHEYEICLDEVAGLGFFIEVEKISDEDGLVVQRELFDFLKTLGVGEEDRVFIGYDSLMLLKNSTLIK